LVDDSLIPIPDIIWILKAKRIGFTIIDSKNLKIKIVLTGKNVEAQRALELLKEPSLDVIEEHPLSGFPEYYLLTSKYELPENVLNSLRASMVYIAESVELLTPSQRRQYFLQLDNKVFPRKLFTKDVEDMVFVA
jgi:hypothetical protein